MTEELMDMEEAKQKMLKDLDEFRRKVETGEIVGLYMLARCSDGYAIDRAKGAPPLPQGVLMLQVTAERARDIFLDGHISPDDGRPRLRTTDDEEE